jgi:hypothetical protein
MLFSKKFMAKASLCRNSHSCLLSLEWFCEKQFLRFVQDDKLLQFLRFAHE